MKENRLYLIGYRGTGKSTTARLLAEKLGWHWLDADAVLEERCSRTIREIFDEEGEPGFREHETQILQEVSELTGHVIAMGGGVVLRGANRELLKRGIVVWLKAPPVLLWQRLQQDATTADRRPPLAQGGLSEIEEMVALRAPLYESCQDFSVDTSQHEPDQVAQIILSWLSRSRVALMKPWEN